MPVFTKILVGLSALTLLLIAGAAYVVLRSNPARDVAVDFSYDAAYVGAPFDVALTVENNTGQLLEHASLQVQGTDNLSVLSGGSESIGEVGTNELTKRTVRVVATPSADSNATYELTAYLSYNIGAGDFQQTYTHAFTFDKPALDVSVVSPQQVVNGSEFTVTLNYRNVSGADIPDVSVSLKKPAAFTVTKTSEPNNSWDIGDIRAEGSGTFTFSGFWYGALAATNPPSLLVTIVSNINGATYPLVAEAVPLAVNTSPLSLSISCDKGTVARAGDTLTYTVSYSNQSGVALRDVTLTANLVGEMFSLGSLSSNGYVNIGQGQITWNKNVIPTFALLPPGAQGAVTVTVPLDSDFPIERLSDKNFTAELDARIASPTVPYYVHADALSSLSSYTVNIAGEAHVSAAAYYRDALAGVANQGNFPPTVGDATQYTIHWKIKNYSTDLQNLVVRAALPDNVTFTGTSKATDGTAPTYDASSHDMVWDIGNLAATRGVLDAPPEAVFQISATPSTSMKGSYELLAYQTRLSATDAFTGVALGDTADAVTTQLTSDTTVSPSEGIVQ